MKKALKIIFIVSIVTAVWVSYAHPDWVVAGLPKHAEALSPVPGTGAQDPLKPVIAEPTTAPVADTSPVPAADPTTHTIPPSVSQGLPLPAIEAVTPKTNHRSDGFDNMCLKMDDGSWTTVIYKGPGGPNMYPYLGDIDTATEAPATAAGSQAWCAEHASV